MVRTVILFSVVTLALVIGLLAVGDAARWPAHELHPHQGEAADMASTAVQAGETAPKPVHSSAALARLVREPQNTWSNLAFVAVGAWLVAARSGLFSQLRRAVGVTLIGVGIGSFFYHASGSDYLRNFDVGAMYWLFLLVTVLCVAAVFPKAGASLERGAWFWLVAALALALVLILSRNVVVWGLKPLALKLATTLAAGVMIGSLALVLRRRESVSDALQMLAVVTIFGAAAACQTFDRPGGRFYRPDAVVQAHAIWHVLAAVAFGWAVKLLTSDRTPESISAKAPSSTS